MSAYTRCAVWFCALAALCFANPQQLKAQNPAAETTSASAAGPAKATDPAARPIDRADNAWILTSSALVLLMTAPGLAMFYGGLVRKKNVLGVMMQCIFLMGLLSVIWALYGYSLSFGGNPSADGAPAWNRWIGGADHLLLKGVAAEWRNGAAFIPTHPTLNIPMLSHMLFQGMFFIITPALICGAFAERMKFSAMVVFSILWGTLVYMPLAHWVWGNGILAFGQPHALAGGALDFAGGTVVHISSGVSALMCAIFIGKRLGFGHEPIPPHNVTYSVLGAAMLWIGWFGFNAGSALAADGIAASAFAATHFAAAAGAISWAVVEWIARGKPSVLGAASGIVAGLVCITPASGYVTPMPAIIMGALAGVVCFWSCTFLKARFRYDDSLDAFGVHGVGGTLGAILTGIFATRAVADLDHGRPLGLLEGGSILVGQLVAVVCTWALAIVASLIILKVVDVVIGLRVSQQQEIQGLDLSQHGEEGYIFI